MFCRIYLSGKNLSIAAIEQYLGELSYVGLESKNSFRKEICDVSIRENKEYDSMKEVDFPDGFLYFKYLIEIEFYEDVSIIEASKEIGLLLNSIWKHYPAVASCDFEEFLPNKGGYNSPTSHWPK